MRILSTSPSLLFITILMMSCTVPKGGGGKGLTITGPFALDSSRVLVARNAGGMINTREVEYGPAITPDGTTLYFVRGGKDHDIWSSMVMGDTLFDFPKRLAPPVNSELSEGAITFSADGKLALFSACNRGDGLGDCDIYEVVASSPGNATMRNVAEINSPEWDSQPAITPDGSRLYFVSDRRRSVGGYRDNLSSPDTDIYMSERLPNGTWGTPRNVGAPINTSRRDDSPCLAFGDSILFFASQGHGGFGGVDLFASTRQPDGSWGTPINLGPVFNSSEDDRFITVAPDGSTFYYSSERTDLPNAGFLDIFVVRTATSR